jgi:signal transduction histidine kinase
METAMHKTLRDQTERVAIQLESTTTVAERARVVENLTRFTDLQIAVITPDTTYGSTTYLSHRASSQLIDADDLPRLQSAETRYAETRYADGRTSNDETLFVAAHYDPALNLIVQVAQAPPPLYNLARRSQWVLILGMVLALILAILGSWVAAYQVTTPLKTISNTASRVAEGRLANKIRIRSRAAEFQDLAESLNRASDAFREKIEELERLTSLQSEFIGNVSHEVRNPIFAISGYLEALGTGTLTDSMRKRYSEKALTNLERLQNLFNDLIEIARLEYREDLIKRKEFDLKDLVHEVAEMLRPKAENKDLDLQIDIPRFKVAADRSRIRQVLVNLIDNAIAYTDSGTVRCRVHRRLDKVRVEVVDTGKGIDEDHLERIFERFYRVDPDRSRESGGTGLGLSIVKQILQAHGEQVHVESTKGRGTRFWFELPYAETPETVDA